jgi:hypothetical protein
MMLFQPVQRGKQRDDSEKELEMAQFSGERD